MNSPWDPEVLQRVRALHLHARQATAGLYQGARRSIRSGHDIEFLDYKQYDPGDSLRDLDWKVYARTDRLVIRRYQAETELGCTILIDASADLGSTPRKFEAAIRAAATSAYLFHLGGDPVGLSVGAGEGVSVRWIPPRTGRTHLARIFSELARLRPAGTGDLDALFRGLGPRLCTRTLALVVSDFMEEPAGWARSLTTLTRNRVDLRALHIYDPDELGLQWTAPTRLRSPETGEELPLDPVAVRPVFEAEVATFFAEVRHAVQARRGQYLRVPAGSSLSPVLARLMLGRGGDGHAWPEATG